MSNQKYMVFDYETFSEADIKRCGGWEYSLHPSTEILCVAFRIGTKAELAKKYTHVWVPNASTSEQGTWSFPLFLSALRDPKIKLVARNAFFEQAITKNVFAKRLMPSIAELKNIPIERWECTAALSRAMGLPGSLEGSGTALGTAFQKDKEGHRHMLKVCRPKKPSKADPSTRHTSKADIDRLVQYCKSDVDADVEIFLKLPPLHPREREFWEMDQRVNARGFAVDRKLVTGAISLISSEAIRLDKKIRKLTNNKIKSARQRAVVLKYMHQNGIKIPDLKSATVKEWIAKGKVKGRPLEILRIRESISRSSTAKYQAFEARSRSDGRARDNLIYHGAHTGRDTGTGLQPQNLFKTILKQEDVEVGLEMIRRKDKHTIEALYDRPMDLYASALRSSIVASEGKLLEVGDFATIEVRVLFWLVGAIKALKALEMGEPIYSDMAGEIYGEEGAGIEAKHKAGDKDGSFKRTVGKHTILGSGFGIGVSGEKFQATCKQFGVTISLELAQNAVKAYRKKYPRVPAFWKNIELAAVSAVENPKKAYRVGYLVWKIEGDWLTCKLPIGRKLHYYKPRVEKVKSAWGPKLTLTYLFTKNGKMYREKTWGGKLTENVTQAVARDVLKEAQMRVEAAGHPVVLAVHDELVGERGGMKVTGWKSGLDQFIDTMEETPEWAKGLPIKVEGWAEARYRK